MAAEHTELLKAIGGVEAMAAMLYRVRLDRELSHRQLAARIERPVGFVVKLEAGEVPEPSMMTAALLASACEVSVSLFIASFALPRDEPLPWPREHRPPRRRRQAVAIPGARARAFGATLRELRLGRKWSRADLGARAGMPGSYIGRMERGGLVSPLLLTVTRVGRAFATTTPAQIAHITQLAQSYAGEIAALPPRRPARDRSEPRVDPD